MKEAHTVEIINLVQSLTEDQRLYVLELLKKLFVR